MTGGRAFRWMVLGAATLFFLTPIGAMLEFSTRGVGAAAPRTLASWTAIASFHELTGAILVSLELALVTSLSALALLLPTLVLVRLRLPRLARAVEFVCLLPLTIPAIVLVVGLAPVYRWISINVSDSIISLSLAYVVLVLPFAFRALDAGLSAIDLRTLSETARSLGAGWFTILWRILVPNLGGALLNAALLSVALVLGEFTFANLLNFVNLQVAIAELGRANAGVSIAVAVASLLFAFVLLGVLSFAGGGTARLAAVAVEEPAR